MALEEVFALVGVQARGEGAEEAAIRFGEVDRSRLISGVDGMLLFLCLSELLLRRLVGESLVCQLLQFETRIDFRHCLFA